MLRMTTQFLRVLLCPDGTVLGSVTNCSSQTNPSLKVSPMDLLTMMTQLCLQMSSPNNLRHLDEYILLTKLVIRLPIRTLPTQKATNSLTHFFYKIDSHRVSCTAL